MGEKYLKYHYVDESIDGSRKSCAIDKINAEFKQEYLVNVAIDRFLLHGNKSE